MTSPEFRRTITLRRRDMDELGHANQAAYHEFLEEARAAFIADLGVPDARPDAYVLARVELDYRREVRLAHGTVDVVVRVERVGGRSLTLGHDVLQPDGTVAATGRTVIVGWDGEGRCARDLTPGEHAALAAHAT
ncbi:hypothetical protein DSM112329_04304 [Paraconexibacter sp. AEG42_29]|uniref:Acyl-CoA thioesterase n=1 Tax=Paraconexibacter sp. AEG42_29 TaxID=2997339 RepID=A0AAU7B0B5_9ACTN